MLYRPFWKFDCCTLRTDLETVSTYVFLHIWLLPWCPIKKVALIFVSLKNQPNVCKTYMYHPRILWAMNPYKFYQLPGLVSDYGHPKMKPSTAFCCGKSRAWPVLGVPCGWCWHLGVPSGWGAATPSHPLHQKVQKVFNRFWSDRNPPQIKLKRHLGLKDNWTTIPLLLNKKTIVTGQFQNGWL